MCNSLEELVLSLLASLMHSCDNHFYLNHHDQGKILSLGSRQVGTEETGRRYDNLTILQISTLDISHIFINSF